MKETVNIKLLFLYLLRKCYLVLLGALLGALLFGGGYYLKNFTFAPSPDWVAKSELYLTYAPEVRLENVYINDYTWQTLSASDACLDEVMANLSFDTTKEYLRSVATAGLESDVRLVILTVTCKNPKEAVDIAHAYENALIKLGERMVDVEEVQIFTSPQTAEKKMQDNRTLRMSITGAVVGAVFALLILLFAFALDDSVFLPEQTRMRYGIPTLLCLDKDGNAICEWNKETGKLNLENTLKDKTKVYLSDVSSETGCGREDIKALAEKIVSFASVGEVLQCTDGINEKPEAVSEIKNSDGVILLLRAENRRGKLLERALDLLKTQNIPVLGFVLYGTHKKRLLRYLGSREK